MVPSDRLSPNVYLVESTDSSPAPFFFFSLLFSHRVHKTQYSPPDPMDPGRVLYRRGRPPRSSFSDLKPSTEAKPPIPSNRWSIVRASSIN